MIVNKTTQINVGDTPINTVYQGETEIWSYFPYTKLNYLQSNGTQWIDSGFTPVSDPITIKMKFCHYSGASVIGNYNEDHYPYYKTAVTIHDGKWYFSHYEPSGYTYTRGVDHDIEVTVVPGAENNPNGTFVIYDNGNLIGSGNKVGPYPPTSLSLTNIYLFTQHNGWQAERPTSNTRIYYMKIYSNNKLIRDFIPVLDTNNIPCLYDKVNRQLYYNQGTGQFLYG